MQENQVMTCLEDLQKTKWLHAVIFKNFMLQCVSIPNTGKGMQSAQVFCFCLVFSCFRLQTVVF
jgi:hypothetical protein